MKQIWTKASGKMVSTLGKDGTGFARGKYREAQMSGLVKQRDSKRAWLGGGRKAKVDADHAALAASRPLKPPGRK